MQPAAEPHDLLTAIREVEQATAERIRQAELDAEIRIARAQSRAKEIEQQARLDTGAEVAAALEAARNELAAEAAQMLAAADEDAAQIRARARLRQAAAVEAIVAYILP
ncbi:MAG: hypothetical protein BWY52_01258 [Chloroflexi bacterium ADurb.Bin325]|nr:MAG: hypothetical protein BWY52_01258 [Chloroflexi bacterium ADurb.Bin325]